MRFWTLTKVFVSLFVIGVFSSPTYASNPMGIAIYSEADNELYMGALFANRRANGELNLDSNAQSRIEIKVLSDKLSYRRLRRHFIHRTAINNGQKRIKRNAKNFERFLNWFNQPLAKGDHIVISKSKQRLSLSVNGSEVGFLNSTSIFEILLNAWVGDTPPSLDFKKKILGLENNDAVKIRFNQLKPESGRSNVAKLWRETAYENMSENEADTQLNAPKGLVSKPVLPKPALSKPVKTTKKKVVSRPVKTAKKKVVSKLAKTNKKKAVVKQKTVKPAPLTKEELAAKEQIIRKNYADILRKHTLERIKFSKNSRPPRYKDTLAATIVVDRSGKLVSMKLTDQSIFSAVNRDIKKGIRNAEPYPLMPTNIPGVTFSFDLSIEVR